MLSRRRFLGSIFVPAVVSTAPAAPIPGAGLRRLLAAAGSAARTPDERARDEAFWFEVQQAYTVDRSLINFNNGGVSPAPAAVQRAMREHLEFSHHAPAYTMWRVLEPQREIVRQRLARAFGCDAEEIAITRNASEGLQILQFGFDLEPGDEVLANSQDYPRMLNTFRQREAREGIVLRTVEVPVIATDPDALVRIYEEAIGPRTRMILVTHVINITGQIMPVRRLVELGRRHGIPVIVDGAHSFAHFPFTRDDLDCDYFATSLHKWLSAPHGTGLLYVRREKIGSLWPLMAATDDQRDDIRKFEEIGTHPAANALAIAEALTFHQAIGGAVKAARLRYLRDRWARRLAEHDRVVMHTSLDPRHSCGIATMQIEGIDSMALASHLWREYRILVAGIRHEQFEGIRVSPSVYSTLEEVDRFADAIETVLRRGLVS